MAKSEQKIYCQDRIFTVQAACCALVPPEVVAATAESTRKHMLPIRVDLRRRRQGVGCSAAAAVSMVGRHSGVGAAAAAATSAFHLYLYGIPLIVCLLYYLLRTRTNNWGVEHEPQPR